MRPTGTFEDLSFAAPELGTSCAFLLLGSVAPTVTGLVGKIVPLHVATCHPSDYLYLFLSR